MFYPVFFQHFPFASSITSAFLKLADLFMSGCAFGLHCPRAQAPRNNSLRLHIAAVTQRSVQQLDKISSLDEVVRRIISVAHSNDPVARALTLRHVVQHCHVPLSARSMVAAFAPLIRDRKDVHHMCDA